MREAVRFFVKLAVRDPLLAINQRGVLAEAACGALEHVAERDAPNPLWGMFGGELTSPFAYQLSNCTPAHPLGQSPGRLSKAIQ